MAFEPEPGCVRCGFAPVGDTPLDLRPCAPVSRTLSVDLGSGARKRLAECAIGAPPLIYDGPAAQRDSRRLFSAVAAEARRGARLLDLGCGPRDQAIPAAHLGLAYVGVDYDNPAADLLADAHAIPFRSGSFELVLSYAVLEHLYCPFLAVQEVARVLLPGGLFFGSVSQGEPFHDSYFHHTAYGLLEALTRSALEPVRLWDSYDTVRALATMGRYPRPGRWLLAAVDRLLAAAPVLAPRKHFRWSERERAVDRLHRAASVCFVARKASAPA